MTAFAWSAVRPLRDYPLVVNVGVLETAALATWRIQAIAIGIGTLLFVCVFAVSPARPEQTIS